MVYMSYYTTQSHDTIQCRSYDTILYNPVQYETVNMIQYYRTCNKKRYHISKTHPQNKFE